MILHVANNKFSDKFNNGRKNYLNERFNYFNFSHLTPIIIFDFVDAITSSSIMAAGYCRVRSCYSSYYLIIITIMSMSMMSMMNALPVSKMTAISDQMFACFFLSQAPLSLLYRDLGTLEVLSIHSYIHYLGMSDALCHTGLSSVALQ